MFHHSDPVRIALRASPHPVALQPLRTPLRVIFFFWAGFLLPTFLFTAFYPNFAGFHEVLPSFTGFSLVLPSLFSFTGFHLVLPSFT